MTHITLTLVLGILSINAIKFLKIYIKLLFSGTKTDGLVVAFEGSNHVMTKNALIPKIKFSTEKEQLIVGKPIHSWFIELSNYKLELDINYVTIYDNSDPNKFVIKSNIELATNLILVSGTLVSFKFLVIKLAG